MVKMEHPLILFFSMIILIFIILTKRKDSNRYNRFKEDMKLPLFKALPRAKTNTKYFLMNYRAILRTFAVPAHIPKSAEGFKEDRWKENRFNQHDRVNVIKTVISGFEVEMCSIRSGNDVGTLVHFYLDDMVKEHIVIYHQKGFFDRSSNYGLESLERVKIVSPTLNKKVKILFII